MKSLKLNILANYFGQFYVAIIGIVMIPVYLRLMGAEAYGLVAFFTTLQSWFLLLDLGLTATVSREAARYLGGGYDATSLRQLLRSLEGFFWVIGLVVGAALALLASQVATRWLNVHELSPHSVEIALMIMALTVALRWISGLYRGLISGLERQIWLSMYNSAVATVRFVGVVPVLLLWEGHLGFFVFQAIVTCVELLVVVAFSYSLVPLPDGVWVKWSFTPVRSVLKFSATVAFTSAVWVLVTQTDKLVVSRFLPLQDFGYFTAAVLVASGIMLIGAPVTLALLPRLTRLSEQGDAAGLIRLYRQATQMIAATAGSAALILGIFGERVLWVWTGDAAFAANYAPVLVLYAIGNGFLALAAFPYYLQYAKGNLRLHFWGNVCFVFVLVPSIVLATMRFGMLGAGAVWALTNAAFFFFWTPLVHRRFAPGLHSTWLSRDVLLVLAPALVLAALLSLTTDLPLGRVGWAAFIAMAACAMVGAALYCCTLIRPQLRALLVRAMLSGR